jgi:hypothetical protein
LICDANGNISVSYDSFDANTKGRPTESGAAVARGRNWHGGGCHGVVARVRLVATTSLSLSPTGANGQTYAAGCRELDHDYAQDAGEPRGRSPGPCEQARPHDKRGHQAGCGSIPGRKAPAWLSGNKFDVASNLSSHSIGCALPSLNRRTAFWFRMGPNCRRRKDDGEEQ